MASGGSITPTHPPCGHPSSLQPNSGLSVEEAAAAGLPVAVHAHSTGAVAAAVDAGVTTIEHCIWLHEGCGGYDTRDDVAERMADRGIYARIACPPNWPGFHNRFGPERAALIIDRFLVFLEPRSARLFRPQRNSWSGKGFSLLSAK
ncbi:hypothetical protein [Amycolatopsis sp. NPDC051071]|uniref:hypothetical protein n=1 Tax=Amycolatopsis sp. NPDC051071 TaxID=3154637 RepID=UPI003418A4D5